MNYFRIPSLFIIILLLLVYLPFISLNPKGAHDFPYSYIEAVREGLNTPLAWSERFDGSLGVYTAATLWGYPLDLLYGLGAKLGMDFSILLRILGIIPILIIGFISLTKLLDSFNLSKRAKLIGSLLYLTNTFILLLIDGGQVNLALAYSFLPGSFYLYKKYFFSNYLKRLYFVLGLLLLSIFDIRIIFFLFILILIDFIFKIITTYQNFKEDFRNGVITSLLTLFFFFCIHSYWLLPSLFIKAPALPENYSSLEQVNFLSFANLGHSISLLSPHWYKNVFGQITPLISYYFLIPLIVFSSLIIRPKDKNVAFWVVIAMLGIFLSKGNNPPLPSVYGWLFTNIPGFSLFRDPVKFYFLTSLSYSILVAFVLDRLLVRFKRMGGYIFISIALLTILFVYPVYTNQMTGLFSSGENIGDYLQLADYLKKDSDFGRILWIPQKPPFGYTNPNHPTINALALVSKRPFASGVKGSYESLNYIREASFAGELLDVAGIKYIVYPPLDYERRYINKDEINYYKIFLDQISQRDWIGKKISEIQIPTFITRKHQQKIFLAQNLWFVVGADSIYEEATKSSILSLRNNALVFLDEQQGNISWIEKYPNSSIALYKKTLNDLAASFIPPTMVYSISRHLKLFPEESHWWKRDGKDLINLREFLVEKYQLDIRDFDLNQGWAISEGDLEIQINPKSNKGDILLARVYESSSSGEINFSQGKQEIGTVKTKVATYQEINVRWKEVGKLLSDEPITIKTQGLINIINALAIMPESDWLNYKDKATKLYDLGRIKDYQEESVLQSTGILDIESINSTRYKVIIRDLKSPAILILTQNYDPLWLSNQDNSIPVYSLLNGFPVQSNGEYIIEYKPQILINFGLLISILTFTVLIMLSFLILISPKKYNR